MTDLHTHILHGIDDGAAALGDSVVLLKAEIDSGVHTVALTPHFYPDKMSIAEFLKKRDKAVNELKIATDRLSLPIRFILGAEVAYSPALLQLELDSLCYKDTKILLIELPPGGFPALAPDVLFKLQMQGYTPMLAHIERYSYFEKSPELITQLVHGGSLTQVTAGALCGNMGIRRRMLKLIANDLVHAIATDAHSFRPPMLSKAKAIVEKKLGKETAEKLVNFEWIAK